MQATENDLSYNSIRLDYQALRRTAVIAFSHTRNAIERLVSQTHELDKTNFSHVSRLLAVEAEKMVVVAETMHTLEEGLTREELEIVNKPEVNKEF